MQNKTEQIARARLNAGVQRDKRTQQRRAAWSEVLARLAEPEVAARREATLTSASAMAAAMGAPRRTATAFA
jgi:hypothetical protein